MDYCFYITKGKYMEFRAGDHVYIPELSEWDQENYEYGWDYGMDCYMVKKPR